MSDNLQREVREITSSGEWLDWRRQDVTASSVAALWDLHPYLSRSELAAKMLGQGETIQNAAMRAGTIMEPAVAAAVQLDHPDWQIEKASTYHRLPALRVGCTPDYFFKTKTVRRGILQCKTTSQQQWENWQGTVPIAYTLQTLAEMLVTDAETGVLAVLIRGGSFPLHEFVVERHPQAEARILDAVASWWQAWDRGEIATSAPSDGLAEMLDDGTHKDLSQDNEIRELLEERRYLKLAIKDAEGRLKSVECDIKNRIGPARTAYVPGWRITFGTQDRKEHVVPAATIRVLRIYRTAEDDA